MRRIYAFLSSTTFFVLLLFEIVPAMAQDEIVDSGRPRARDPMQFEWVRQRPGLACPEPCQDDILANGTIVASTPKDFSSFIGDRDVRGRVLIFNSTGGSVAAGLG